MLANSASSRRPRSSDAPASKNKKHRPPDAAQNGVEHPVDGVYPYHPEDDVILKVYPASPPCVASLLTLRSQGGDALADVPVCRASASIGAGDAWT